jgi:ATP-dependent exoDNAse (exonuclease V) alpha subunit
MPQAPRASAPTEVLAGLIERVTFHNDENGFCVLRVKARGQRDLITVLGHAAMIAAGEFVQASGTWVNDRTHGVQFRASFLKAAAPTTIEGIEKYLGSGMIRGIGPVYAKKLGVTRRAHLRDQMRMGGFSWLSRRGTAGDHTHALFADQSHSLPDNLVALLRRL